MTLQQLEYIVAVDRYRHFVKAAEHCGVTQPTLSAMVGKLEDELGAKLFDRSRQPVVPTPIGTKVIAQARRILSQTADIGRLVDEEQHSLRGLFTIGVLPTIAPYLLPRFFSRMRDDHPELDLRVVEMKTDGIRTALSDGSIDAGILADMPLLSAFNRRVLYYDEFFAYVSPRDTLATRDVIRTDDLRNAQLYLLDEGHCFRDQIVRFCQLRSARHSQTVYRLGSMETFMHIVEGGQGLTFIPQSAIDFLSAEQRSLLKPFAVPRPTRTIVVATLRDFLRNTVLDALVQAVRDAMPPEMLRLAPTQVAI